MPSLAEFLKRNSVNPGAALPLVHSVSAYHLIKKIRPDNAISPVPCDVFTEDNLNYFFMGRPAYKVTGDTPSPAEWELPCCFIFEYEAISGIRRIFPFDSGAHHLGLYPNYIQMMDKDEFEVASIPDAPARIIGAYFGDARSYFDLKPKSDRDFKDEFAIGVLDSEIFALHKLASDPGTASSFDDRRLTIEVQSDRHVDLNTTKPLAVILPVTYLDNPEVRNTIENKWGAEAITYPILSLSVRSYYATIYEKVLNFYISRGFL